MSWNQHEDRWSASKYRSHILQITISRRWTCFDKCGTFLYYQQSAVYCTVCRVVVGGWGWDYIHITAFVWEMITLADKIGTRI